MLCKKGECMALVICRECGKQISDQAAACPSCGAPALDRSQSPPAPVVVAAPKSRSVAVLLAMLLGGLGLHKFYLNSPGWGVIYLLFCWTFIPAIIGFIEGLVYLFMSDQVFQQKYGALGYNTLVIGSHAKRIKECSYCGAKNRSEDYTCIRCGKPLL